MLADALLQALKLSADAYEDGFWDRVYYTPTVRLIQLRSDMLYNLTHSMNPVTRQFQYKGDDPVIIEARRKGGVMVAMKRILDAMEQMKVTLRHAGDNLEKGFMINGTAILDPKTRYGFLTDGVNPAKVRA